MTGMRILQRTTKENDESAVCGELLTESDGNEVSGGFPVRRGAR